MLLEVKINNSCGDYRQKWVRTAVRSLDICIDGNVRKGKVMEERKEKDLKSTFC